MANTVIAVRSSGTAAATPSLGVIANGEIALNFADGIIYYKTSSNTLGSIRTTQPAGLTTEVQFNDAGSFGSNVNFTFNKTIATLNVKNINVSTNLIATTTNLTVSSITTGSGTGGIIAGANVVYSNVFVANSGGYIQFADGSKQYVANATPTSVVASAITGVMNLTQGGTNATSYTTGAILTSNGTAFVVLANTGTAGVYANASHVPVITTDAYGRVSAITNTAIAISAAAITSGTLAVAQGGTGVTTSTGTGSVTLNTSPVLTTPNIGVPSFATLTNATGLPVSGITASTSTALGVGSVELGHASDTTLSRSSAGVLAVEGIVVPTVSSTSTLTNKTLTFPVIDNIKMGFTTTATAAGTTTLTSASNYYQRFTGSTTQTVVLPVTSTLVAGVAYEIENASTGNLTVNSSGGNLVVTIIPGVTVQCMCIGTALTTAADWDSEYNEFASITGTGAVVLNTAPTLTSINVTNTTVSTSNITGALTIAGGAGVKGNVYADNVFIGGQQAGTIGDAMAMAIALG
jgi:hypothetical protein